ncbi:MAG: ATP phosphoribosyltransferase [Erysipelotrichia bacterium]|nr:ATP phosphoribosyltransferase [Erysipelotrichia bacterium]
MSLQIALTKGRLEESAVEMLDQCGYGIDRLRHKGRALVFQDTKKEIRYFLSKANDVITYVEHGVADIGIVGKDTLLEGGQDYYELLDLGIGQCRFILAGLPDHNPLQKVGHLRIGTKYPSVTRTYFRNMGMDPEIIKIDGSVELGPLLNLCDAIVDITETGTTLKENGLIIYDEVCRISARAIVNKASFKLKRDEVMQVINDLKGVMNNAEGN